MPSSEAVEGQQPPHHVFHHDFIATPSPLFPSNLQKSILSVSPERLSLSTSTSVTLAWHIHDCVMAADDTIGIFLPGKAK